MANPEFLAGQTVSAAKLQRLGDDLTYVPALVAATTNPTLGTGSFAEGRVHLNGQMVTIWFAFRFGTSGAAAGSGAYQCSLPPAYPVIAGSQDVAIGTCRLIDDGTAEAVGICMLDSANNRFWIRATSTNTLVSEASPWVWNNLDYLMGEVSYLTDFNE